VPLGISGVVDDDLNNPAPVVEGSVWYELHYRRAKTPTLMVDGALDRCARDDLMFTAGLVAPLEGGGVLVLDLDGVTSMDRFGARAVLELRRALARRATKLRLVNVPPCVACAFRSIGVLTIARGSNQLN
jgi:ABC-type transporter Mla MlaB component